MNELLINDLSSECVCGDSKHRRWNIYKTDKRWHGKCLACGSLLATPYGFIFQFISPRVLPRGMAYRTEAQLPDNRTAAVTLWHNTELAPLPAPPRHCNTWIATIDDAPIHEIGLPHKRDAQEALYKALGISPDYPVKAQS